MCDMDEASQQSHIRATNISPLNIVTVNSTNFDYWFGNEMRRRPFFSSASFSPEVRYPAPHLRHTLPIRDNMHNDEVPSLRDHYNDMRLDIDNMSYEELLGLGDRIGHVGTSLLDKIIARQMRTKTYILLDNLEGSTSQKQKIDLCIICQDEYKNEEEIGILQCRHEYHVDCIRRWLHEKNVCPLCKSKAFTIE